MTPHELRLHADAYNERRTTEGEELIIASWLMANWQRAKKMPSLNKALGKEQKRAKAKTPQEMLEEVKRMNAALGGTTY